MRADIPLCSAIREAKFLFISLMYVSLAAQRTSVLIDHIRDKARGDSVFIGEERFDSRRFSEHKAKSNLREKVFK